MNQDYRLQKEPVSSQLQSMIITGYTRVWIGTPDNPEKHETNLSY